MDFKFSKCTNAANLGGENYPGLMCENFAYLKPFVPSARLMERNRGLRGSIDGNRCL